METDALYLTNSLHDLASSINDMIVIAATRTTRCGAEMDVFHRFSLYLDLKHKLPRL